MPCHKSLLGFALLSLFSAFPLRAACSPSVAVLVPPAGCKSGTATAAVVGVPGATYAWTVEGGSIAGGATSDRINISLGTGATATAAVTVTAAGCESRGTGVITLHDPFRVRITPILDAPSGEPLIIRWTYENGAPAQQTLSGSDFGIINLAPDARSYKYTPQKSGNQQIVVDAAMATAGGSPGAPSKRRAVASAPVSASLCATAHATAPYTITNCIAPQVQIDGPASVVTGTVVQFDVRPQAGTIPIWTITNGSPATATGENIQVTAGAIGSLGVHVRLERGNCFGEGDRNIAVTAKADCSGPKAVVTAGPVSCGSASVNATFTGVPPFHGNWSDNFPFTTNNTFISRTVTSTGNYTINNFGDAICNGSSSGAALVPALGPTATLIGKTPTCAGIDTMVIEFTGKPPFYGRWSDQTEFTTNDMHYVKPIPNAGKNEMVYGFDATLCNFTIFGNGVNALPTQQIKASTFCLPEFDNVVSLKAEFNGYFTPPLTVTWADGVTVSSDSTPVYRTIKPQQTTTYTIVSAQDAFCNGILSGPLSVTIYASPIPDFTLGTGTLCSGTTRTVSLAVPPPAGAQVSWSIDNGSIVSGQGTSSAQYKTGEIGAANIGCTFTFPDDRCPTFHREAVRVTAVDPPGTLSLASATVHAGQTVDITYSVDYSAFSWTLDNTLNDAITPLGICNQNQTCHALYTSSHGTGLSTVTLHVTGFCQQTKDVSVQLEIVP